MLAWAGVGDCKVEPKAVSMVVLKDNVHPRPPATGSNDARNVYLSFAESGLNHMSYSMSDTGWTFPTFPDSKSALNRRVFSSGFAISVSCDWRSMFDVRAA